MHVPSVDVLTFAAECDALEPFILDVREPHEAAICSLEGAVLIPLGELPRRMDEIPDDRPVVVHCHHGGRSAKAVQYLLTQGFTDVRNLSGGIHQWAEKVDPDMIKY